MSSSGSAAPTRGRLISLEGGEGAGKSTQLRMLVARLQARDIAVIATREPGGTDLAERYRDVLLEGRIAPLGPAAEALMFSAARIDHVDRKIVPSLEAGTSVVCDRFIDSTRAYQGAAGRLDPGLIAALERVVVGPVMPDLTLILDLPVEIGTARAAARRNGAGTPDRFEGQGRAFHEALRRAFLDVATRSHHRCYVIDATNPVDVVADQIWHVVVERLYPFLSAGERPDAGLAGGR